MKDWMSDAAKELETYASDTTLFAEIAREIIARHCPFNPDAIHAGRCDVCGAPATNMARDMIEHRPSGLFRTFTPSPELKRGCDMHPTVSKEIVR